MNQSKWTFRALAITAGVLLGAPVVWAESQVGDPGDFGIVIDPNASGTKVSGNVSFTWDFREATASDNCLGPLFVQNIYAVATMVKGNQIQPFNANYKTIGIQNLPACFDNQANQVQFMNAFIANVIIPGFYNCVSGGCPGYTIKSIKNFLTSGHGAGSMDLELAVK